MARLDVLLTEHPVSSTPPEQFWAAQFDAGLAWVHFPVGLGGLDAPAHLQELVSDRLRSAGAPANALRKGPAGDHVFVLAADAQGQVRAQQRTVQVAALLGEEVVLESGLSAGERVAAAGSFKLRDAALVAVAEPASAGGTR